MIDKAPENAMETVNGIDQLKERIKLNFRKLLHEWIFFQMKFIREEGLAIPQLFTLRYLYYNRPKDLSSIADFMGVSKPTVTGIMNTLEREGFVRREHDPDDRRRIDIVLTEKSLGLFRRTESMTTFVFEEFINSIPEDSLEKIGDTMTAIAKELREASYRKECNEKE